MDKEFEILKEKIIFDISNFKTQVFLENKELQELIKRKNEQYLELEKYNDTLLKSINSFQFYKTKKELQIQFLKEENLKITKLFNLQFKSHFREIKTLHSKIEHLSKYKELYDEIYIKNKELEILNSDLISQIENLRKNILRKFSSIDEDPRLP